MDLHHDPTKDDRETILLGIDGTGELEDRDYQHGFKNSFVNYIVRASHAKYKHYVRGPFADGIDMGILAGKGYTFVHLTRAAHPKTKVLLVGYSRGGAGVIDVARRLKNDGVAVDGMVLFDPVDRSGTSDAYDVPNNVLQMFQALRATMTLSRISFNNCAVSWHSPTRCARKYFWATHGGLGGVPWKAQLGQSSKEYIDENASNTETGLAWVVYDALRFKWEQPDDYHGTLDALRARRRELLGNRTQVTYEEDAKGATQVWEWIYPKLLQLGYLRKNA